MGYSQLFAQGWTWGNLLAEGVGAFLFALMLIVGRRFIDNTSASPLAKRALLGVSILVIVLISALVSLGISELYRKSSGAPVLTPIFGLFYGFVIGSYETVGIIIAAQLVGSFIGFALALLLRPRLHEKLEGKQDNSARGIAWRGLAIVFLLVGVAIISLINPTSYGGTAVIKILIMAIAIGGFVTVFGGAEFYSYVSFYHFLNSFVQIRFKANISLKSENADALSGSYVFEFGKLMFVRITVKDEGVQAKTRFSALSSKHTQALLFQFVALGILIGIYALVQSFPNSLTISNVI